MADTERRYGPTIDLQGFDLTMNVDAVQQPSRLPLVVVIALVVLAAFAGVVWLAYTQGVERGRESVSGELTARQFWKVSKPAQPAYTGLKIYEPPGTVEQNPPETAAVSSKPKVTNAVPSLRPTASAAPDTTAPALPRSANPVAGIAAPDQVGGSPARSEGNKRAAGSPIKSGTAVPGESAKRVATRAPTPLTNPAAAASLAPVHPLTEPESLAPAPAATLTTPPAPKPATAAAQTPAAVSAPAAASTHVGVSGILLQIGSYKSEAEAKASWQAFKSEHDVAAGYQPDVKQVELGARGTWYRLRMGPFPDKTTALEACRKLKADGASCLLAQ